MTEDIAGKYFSILRTSTNPGLELARLYCEMFSLDMNPKIVMMMNKLIKLYGRNLVFLATTDLYWVENLDLSKSIFPLLKFLCKKRFQIENTDIINASLEETIGRLEKEKKLMKKQKISPRNPF
jgi:DNA-binding XRE family transcriptional regulator